MRITSSAHGYANAVNVVSAVTVRAGKLAAFGSDASLIVFLLHRAARENIIVLQ
jgi:hypothetical protein